MNGDMKCSQCRHWDLKHAQQTDVGEDGIPIKEYFALCLNLNCYFNRRYVEADDGCGIFEQR